MEKKDLQWDILEKGRQIIEKFAIKNEVNLFKIHFITADFSYSLEIYIFYKTDKDLVLNKENGTDKKIEDVFKEFIFNKNYKDIFGDKIKFIFDSDENVKKNYKGSYFFRLR